MSIYSDCDIDKISLSEYCYLEGEDDPYPDYYDRHSSSYGSEDEYAEE